MILIVDDDQSVRMSLGLMLKQAGYDYETVSTEADTMAMVRQRQPELVILDMNLTLSSTGEQGIEMLRKLKILIPETPVILISAWGTIPLAVEGMMRGAADFITKPWSNRDVLAKIRKALSKSAEETAAKAQTKSLEDTERDSITEALKKADGNISKAAEQLGITRQSLYRRMKKLNIEFQ